MAEEIKVGSRVTAVKEGAVMTVKWLREGVAECWWFKKTTETFTYQEFRIEMLKVSNPATSV